MTALGTYLLVSLFFIIATLVEFAVVLEMKQSCKKKTSNAMQVPEGIIMCRNKVDNIGINEKVDNDLTALEQTAAKIAKIDRISLILFPILYLIFNFLYWASF